jgi:hypothetical protein
MYDARELTVEQITRALDGGPRRNLWRWPAAQSAERCAKLTPRRRLDGRKHIRSQ